MFMNVATKDILKKGFSNIARPRKTSKKDSVSAGDQRSHLFSTELLTTLGVDHVETGVSAHASAVVTNMISQVGVDSTPSAETCHVTKRNIGCNKCKT